MEWHNNFNNPKRNPLPCTKEKNVWGEVFYNLTGKTMLNTIEFLPDFVSNSTSAYNREGYALINLLFNFPFDENIEELKFNYPTYRAAWEHKKDADGVRPYRALHQLHNKLNNFTITDDVCLVLPLDNKHGLAQDHLKSKGYSLLKGRDRNGLGL